MEANNALKNIFSNSTIKPFLHNAWDNSGFEKLTPIQEKTISLIVEGKDIIGESPTGSGKTLAYLLPLLQQIDVEKKNVQAMILASSHELVMQINQELQQWTKDSGISSATLIGGANIKRQQEKLKKRPQLVIGTPGRVEELIKIKKLKVHEVKTIVLDEGDQLLVLEHFATIKNIINSTLSERQLLLFSATLPSTIEDEAKSLMVNPEVIRVHTNEVDRPPVDHIYILSEARDKIELLRKIVRMNDMKALVFFKDIGNLSVVAEKLEYMGIPVSTLHGDSKKQMREKAIKNFRTGESQLLLATDVAARGLDIPDLAYIIQMDIPNESRQYIHRSGRTGRLGSTEGTVISIVTTAEERLLKKFSLELEINVDKKRVYKGQLLDETKK